MIDPVLSAILEVAKELPRAVSDAIDHGCPTADEHRFERSDGAKVGFGIFIVPSGPAHDAILAALKAHFGEPVLGFQQEFSNG